MSLTTRIMSHAAGAMCTAQAVEPAKDALLTRGKYLVHAIGCIDCHAPLRMGPNGPEPDLSRGLSGNPQDLAMPQPPRLGQDPWQWVGAATNTAFTGPWGASYAANLTPDLDTGIGLWREQDFIRTIRTGKHLGVSRPILPPCHGRPIGI